MSLTLTVAAAAFLVAAREPAGPSFASDGASGAAAWTPAPLLALLLVAAMSGLVLLVSFQPRRG